MKIALQLAWLNDGTHKNFIGDHGVAQSWAKYLRRLGVEVNIFGERVHDDAIAGHDVVIHWWPWMKRVPGAKNILYLQNALSREDFGMDTVGVFRDVADRFDGYIYPSETLKRNCGRDGLVLPFAADPEIFTYQPDEKFAYPVAFVGNDIRPAEVNERYLVPALAHGLVIHSGGVWRDPRLQAVNRGRISAEDLPKLYSSARVCLNITHPEHVKNGVVNSRIYEILACGGAVLSDAPFDNSLETIGVDERGWQSCLEKLLSAEWLDRHRQWRRDLILHNHTYAHRMADLQKWLGEIV